MNTKKINILILITLLSVFFSKILAIFFLLVIFFLINFYKKKENNIYDNQINSIKTELLRNEKIKIKTQINVIENKIKILDEILSSIFGNSSITYIKFNSTIKNIHNLFKENIDKIILKMQLLDEDKLIKYHTTKDLSDINNLIKNNDLLLDKLNNLIIKLSELSDNDNENKSSYLLEQLTDLNTIMQKFKTL